jgi:hypothetical protein
MSGQFYDNPERTFHYIDDAVTTTAAALLDGIIGPAGKVGRVRRLEAVVTTVYVGTDTIDLDEDTPALAVPPTLAITGADGAVVRATQAALDGFSDLPADTPILLSTDGLSTSGLASISVAIDWY